MQPFKCDRENNEFDVELIKDNGIGNKECNVKLTENIDEVLKIRDDELLQPELRKNAFNFWKGSANSAKSPSVKKNCDNYTWKNYKDDISIDKTQNESTTSKQTVTQNNYSKHSETCDPQTQVAKADKTGNKEKEHSGFASINDNLKSKTISKESVTDETVVTNPRQHADYASLAQQTLENNHSVLESVDQKTFEVGTCNVENKNDVTTDDKRERMHARLTYDYSSEKYVLDEHEDQQFLLGKTIVLSRSTDEMKVHSNFPDKLKVRSNFTDSTKVHSNSSNELQACSNSIDESRVFSNSFKESDNEGSLNDDQVNIETVRPKNRLL